MVPLQISLEYIHHMLIAIISTNSITGTCMYIWCLFKYLWSIYITCYKSTNSIIIMYINYADYERPNTTSHILLVYYVT